MHLFSCHGLFQLLLVNLVQLFFLHTETKRDRGADIKLVTKKTAKSLKLLGLEDGWSAR